MRKYLKFFLFPAIFALTFSMSQKTQGMDSSIENFDKNISGSSGILQFERGTYDVLNQDIIHHDYICSRNHEEKKNLIEPAPLIKGSERFIKEGLRYTLEHPIQTAILGIACQLGEVNAFSEGAKYGLGTMTAVFEIVSIFCEGFGEHSSIPDTDSWNKSKYAFSCLAVLSGVSTGAMIFWDGYLKSILNCFNNLKIQSD